MYKIQFTELAEEDLLSILRYISEVLKSPTAAKNLLIEIEEQITLLELMPFSCSLVLDDYLASKGIRSLLVKNYHIFYTINDSENIVSIIRVLYARRDWAHLLVTKTENNEDQ